MMKRLKKPRWKGGSQKLSDYEKRMTSFEEGKKKKVDKRLTKQKELAKAENDEKKKLIMPDIDGYLTKAVNILPRECILRYGCLECEWKTMNMCPYKFKRKTDKHSRKICIHRATYLASFMREGITNDTRRPTFARWHKDFLVGKAASKENRIYTEIELLQAELDKMKNDVTIDPKEISVKERALDKKHAQWQSLWRDVVNIEDKQVDRETPKKMEIEHSKKMSPSQLHSIMRGDFIDVEAKEIKDAD